MGRRRTKDKHLPERVYKKHGGYYYVTSENKWQFLGSNLAEAMGKWTEIVGEPDELVTMADVIDRYVIEEIPKKAETTQKDQRRQIQNLRRAFGHMKPDEITPQHIFAYRDKRGKTAPIQANREKSLMSHIFTKAMEWGVASKNPCKGVPRFTEIKRDRYIEDDEFIVLYKEASPVIQCAMDIAYMTSMDLSVILNLPPIDTKLNEFRYKRRKTRKNPIQKTMVLELTTDLKKVIERTKNLPGHIRSVTHLIRNREGKSYTLTGFESIWQRVKKKAGLNDIQFRDLRAKAGTDKERESGKEEAQRMLGHHSITTTDIYIRSRKGDRVIPNKKLQN